MYCVLVRNSGTSFTNNQLLIFFTCSFLFFIMNMCLLKILGLIVPHHGTKTRLTTLLMGGRQVNMKWCRMAEAKSFTSVDTLKYINTMD